MARQKNEQNATINPATAPAPAQADTKKEKEKKNMNKENKQPANKETKGTKTTPATKKAPAQAKLSECGQYYNFIIPAIKSGAKIGEYNIVVTEDNKLRIDTKVVNKSVMLADSQKAILDTMREKENTKKAKLEKNKKEKAEEWTESDQLNLDKTTALLKCIDIQRKKYTASKHNPRAILTACVMLGTTPNIEIKSLVGEVRTSWNCMLEVLENAYNQNKYEISKEQQESMTNMKKIMKSAMLPYTSKVEVNNEVIADNFEWSISNKDIIKMLMSLYEGYRRNKEGEMKDGLKLDGKEENALKKEIVNMCYAKMTGNK